MAKVTRYRGDPDPEPREPEDRDFVLADAQPPREPKRADFDQSVDEAVRAATARLGSPEAARRFLSARAQAGALATIATHYIIDRPGYFDTLDEHELGDEFLSRCDWAAGDWHIGDFEAHEGRHVTLKACGVRFKGAEIDAAIAALPEAPNHRRAANRPEEIDWARVREEAEKLCVEAARAGRRIGQSVLNNSLRHWYRDEVEHPHRKAAPREEDLRAESGFRAKLKEWNLPPQ